MNLDELLRGREIQRCTCGLEIVAREIIAEGGERVTQFVPCRCGSRDPIQVEPGSVVAGFTPSVLYLWGPARTTFAR